MKSRKPKLKSVASKKKFAAAGHKALKAAGIKESFIKSHVVFM